MDEMSIEALSGWSKARRSTAGAVQVMFTQTNNASNEVTKVALCEPELKQGIDKLDERN